MQVDPYNRSVHGLTTLLAFIALNVMYILTCLPVITIGVATSALFEVTMRYADEERGDLIKGYVVALGRNLGQATAAFLALGLPAGLLAFAAVFWFSYDSTVSGAAAILAGLGSAYLFGALLWALALVAAFRNSLGQTLRNALLLPVTEALRTVGLVLVPWTLLALSIVAPGFVWLTLTLGLSLGAYGMAFLFRSGFARYRDPEN